MPLYDYECQHCGAEFEEFSIMASRDVMTCANCGKPARRLITGGNFMLMGGGWSRSAGHGKIIPADGSLNPQPVTDDEGWQTNYYNCTPEDVHRT